MPPDDIALPKACSGRARRRRGRPLGHPPHRSRVASAAGGRAAGVARPKTPLPRLRLGGAPRRSLLMRSPPRSPAAALCPRSRRLGRRPCRVSS
eukprot:6012380-Pleurochrysis_carterae.AAC.1